MEKLARILKAFHYGTSGAVLVELLLAAPILFIFTAGLFEVGSIFWQRQQVQIGVRDAARYLSRCNASATYCDYTAAQTTARNLALYASPTTQTALRVPGWDDPTTITITPATLVSSPSASDLITVSASTPYVGSPFFTLLGFSGINLTYTYSMRHIGW